MNDNQPQLEMNEDEKRALADFLVLSVTLNKPDFSVFVEYSGHVNQLLMRIYPGGWVSGIDYTHSNSLWFPLNRDHWESEDMLEKEIMALTDWINGLSVDYHLNSEANRNIVLKHKEKSELEEYERLKAKFEKVRLECER
jgi:hypothetical protein